MTTVFQMDSVIVSSLLLLALIVSCDSQEFGKDLTKSSREILSSDRFHLRKVRDIDATNSSKNGTIEPGVETGICLNITMKEETKYEVKRKSSVTYYLKPGCWGKSMMDCYEPRLTYKSEIVPEKHSVKVREPFCCEGYKQVADGSSDSIQESKHISRSWPDGDIYCKPNCDPPCVNGHCIAPDVCGCPREMVLLEDRRTCETPKCEPECLNADCVGNNTCKCHRLYVKEADDPNTCLPLCAVPCTKNSYCYAPNECRCMRGHKRHFTSRECEPVCQLGCVNGFCSGEKECTCFDGYKMVTDSKNKCEPVCENCVNGVCTAPGICKCNDSYKYDEKTKKCEPVCQLDCVNGFCSGPNECKCFDGYRMVLDSMNKCEPVCENCFNGKCTAPGICKCNDSYKYDEKTKGCLPECHENCTTGCDEPMHCKDCDEGYKRINGSIQCIPQCKGCSNGDCFIPGVCVCRDGYKRDKDDAECIPKCFPDCKNGLCTAPNTCSCLKGYHLENDNVCESDTESCQININDKIIPDKCINLDGPLKMYTDNCSTDFTNSSCFEELCSSKDSENNSVCQMKYVCDVVQTSSLPHCRWRNLKNISNNSTVQLESNTSMDVKENTANMQDDNLPLFSLKSDFDLNPCLLCLCPVNEQRNFCFNGSYAFELCPCVPENAITKKIEDSETDFFHRYNHIFLYVLYAVCCLFIVLAVVAVKIKCGGMKTDSQTYTVSSFSNDLYYEGKFEEAEHVYAEIETDGYEQPAMISSQNIILEFS